MIYATNDHISKIHWCEETVKKNQWRIVLETNVLVSKRRRQKE